MARANWVAASEQIAGELEGLRHDQSLTMSIEELMQRLGADEDRPVYRGRGAWASIQRGDRDWDVTRRAGLVANFWPDETGRPVEQVTFRLDRFQAGQLIDEAAERLGQSTSDFAVSTLVRTARCVLEEQAVTRLTNRDRDLFIALLDAADASPNEALKAAATRHKRQVT